MPPSGLSSTPGLHRRTSPIRLLPSPTTRSPENLHRSRRLRDPRGGEPYAGMVLEISDNLTPEERHSIYKMLRLRIVVSPDGPVEITGVFGGLLEARTSSSVKSESM